MCRRKLRPCASIIGARSSSLVITCVPTRAIASASDGAAGAAEAVIVREVGAGRSDSGARSALGVGGVVGGGAGGLVGGVHPLSNASPMHRVLGNRFTNYSCRRRGQYDAA